MKSILVIIFLLCANLAYAISSTPKSFNQWKFDEIRVARRQLQNTKASLKRLQQRHNYLKLQDNKNNTKKKRLEAQQVQNQWNLEVAQDLAITDYVVLYLSQQKSADKFEQAAMRMNSRETAKILAAYLQAVQTHDEDRRKYTRLSFEGEN